MKLLRILNCFFVIALFNAGASALALDPDRSLTAVAEKGPENQPTMKTKKKIGPAIHGGAGTIERSKMTPEKEREYRAGLERALTAGYETLKRGGSCLESDESGGRRREA